VDTEVAGRKKMKTKLFLKWKKGNEVKVRKKKSGSEI
jgi:hypothetical protein